MSKSNAAVIICTRKESTRLPGKALLTIAGLPAIEHILRRLPQDLDVILAVPFGQFEDFHRFVNCHPRASVFPGNPDSPLHRMRDAVLALPEPPKFIIRITHDDILIDAQELSNLLYQAEAFGAGYAVSDGILEGAGVEIFRTENLIEAAERNQEPVEHISYFVTGPGMPFPSFHRFQARSSVLRPYRLTMDYPEDFVVLETVLRRLGPLASNDEICAYLDSNKHILKFNRLPEVSIYTCARNAERFVGECISSVMNSGLLDMEYIIVEDGSTDNTLGRILPFVNGYQRSGSEKNGSRKFCQPWIGKEQHTGNE